MGGPGGERFPGFSGAVGLVGAVSARNCRFICCQKPALCGRAAGGEGQNEREETSTKERNVQPFRSRGSR